MKQKNTLVDTAFYDQVRSVIQDARRFVHATANVAMVKAYWLVGKMIVEKQGGAAKAAYGDGLVDSLSAKLTAEFGAGFTRVNLFAMRKFYLAFPKVQTLCELLSWSHYRLLITVENEEARQYYAEECKKFLLELGRGFSFVERQKRLTLDGEHYHVDLVFYNYLLKCFVLVDLKTDRLTHADLGQMQMYVNYYERELMNPGDNPPIGIVLCTEKGDDLVRYTLPLNEKRIFASKYKLVLPTEAELLAEIRRETVALENALPPPTKRPVKKGRAK